MSPQSRSRRKKSGNRRGPTPANPFAEILRRFTPMALAGDVVAAEDSLSFLLDELQHDAEPTFLSDLLDHLHRQVSVPALAMLRVVAELAASSTHRVEAAFAADRIATRVAGPSVWKTPLADPDCVAVWRAGDVYRDSATLLFIFDRAGSTHGLLAEIDLSFEELESLALVEDCEGLLTHLRADVTANELFTLAEIEPGVGRRLMERALSAFERDPIRELRVRTPELGGPEPEWVGYRPLVVARMRTLPVVEPSPEVDAVALAALAARFFADNPDPRHNYPIVEELIEELLRFGVVDDDNQPLRVGPGKFEAFLELMVPMPKDVELFVRVLGQFVHWAAPQVGLPEIAMKELLADLADLVAQAVDDEPDE